MQDLVARDPVFRYSKQACQTKQPLQGPAMTNIPEPWNWGALFLVM